MFQNLANNNFQVKHSDRFWPVCLAEWIIDDTCLVFTFFRTDYHDPQEENRQLHNTSYGA